MPLVRNETLEDAWESVLSTALGRRVDAKALAVMVARQSARYRGESVILAQADGLAARALFWFARDVHKCALPVHELLAAGAIPDRPLRVLDLGAGLGATSLGAGPSVGGAESPVEPPVSEVVTSGDTVAGPHACTASVEAKTNAAPRLNRCVVEGTARAASCAGSAPPQNGQWASSART